MRGKAAWKLLGIAPTTDTRDIRRAYAAVLKAGDYDSDAMAFMALREARDFALNHAAGAEDDDDPYFAFADEAEAVVAGDDFETPEIEQPAPPERTPFMRACQALYDALYDETSDADLQALLDAVLHDPQMDDIGTHADTEIWLSEIIADAIPRSDRLILPVGKFFGWQARVGQIGLPWSVDHLTQRQKALAFFDTVQVKGHRYYREWRELTTPATSSSRRGWGLRRKNVMGLLDMVRRDCPDLESCFDVERVALWDTGAPVSTGGFSFSWWWIGIVVAIQLARLIGQSTPPSETRIPNTIKIEYLTNKDADIDVALRNTTVKGAELKAKNPKLYAAFEKKWEAAFAKKQLRWDFIADASDMARDHYRYGAVRAPYALIADRRRLDRDMAKHWRAISAEECDAYFKGKLPPAHAWPTELYQRQTTLQSRSLLEVLGPVAKSDVPRRFTIPGSTVDRIKALTKLPDARLDSALQGRGTAADNCNVRIALIDAALEAPRDVGIKMLWAM